MTGDRDAYRVVGVELRKMLQRANKAVTDSLAANHRQPLLTPTDWRVLAAVVDMTASRSLLGDRIFVGQIASHTYDVERSAEWQTKSAWRSLRKLHDLGILIYEPGRGKRASVIVLGAGLEPIRLFPKGVTRKSQKGVTRGFQRGVTRRTPTEGPEGTETTTAPLTGGDVVSRGREVLCPKCRAPLDEDGTCERSWCAA